MKSNEIMDTLLYIQADSCYVEGVCTTQAETNPKDICEECQPAISSHAWTRKGNEKDFESSVCMINIVIARHGKIQISRVVTI